MASPVTTPEPAPGFWVHNLDPFIFRFPEGWPLDGVRWYGTAYLAGFAVGWLLLLSYHKRGRSPLNPDQVSTLMFALVLGVLGGARLGYILGYGFETNPELLRNPLKILEVWKGGMSSHGGMIGVLLAVLWFWKRSKVRFWRLLDMAATLAPAGIFFGRIANFINGELWGKTTDVRWAVIFQIRDAWGRMAFLEPRHPSQLYAAAMEGLLLLAWTQWSFWKRRLPEGQLVGEWMCAYAVVRIFGEIYRQPDDGVALICGLSRGQIYSVVLGLAGIATIFRARKSGHPWTPPAPPSESPSPSKPA
ncbi:MAG: prolipoprotein diacylglyceryl transferase [Puniceicoccales bacterium]|jgi:phosphatidylglycerol:prolipoprotein diacylglycerol transferase|nr:prolipoprotein diacylglyceryl transferase [Puniceicoccales bacterium]